MLRYSVSPTRYRSSTKLPKGVTTQQLEEVRLFNATLTTMRPRVARVQRRKRGKSSTAGTSFSSPAPFRNSHDIGIAGSRYGNIVGQEHGRLALHHEYPTSLLVTKKPNSIGPASPARAILISSIVPKAPKDSASASVSIDQAGHEQRATAYGYSGQGQSNSNFINEQTKQVQVAVRFQSQFDAQPLQRGITGTVTKEGPNTADHSVERKNAGELETRAVDLKPLADQFGGPASGLSGLSQSKCNTELANLSSTANPSEVTKNQHLKYFSSASFNLMPACVFQHETECSKPACSSATPSPKIMDSSNLISISPIRTNSSQGKLINTSLTLRSENMPHLLDFQFGDTCNFEALRPSKPRGNIMARQNATLSDHLPPEQSVCPPTLKNSCWAPRDFGFAGVVPSLPTTNFTNLGSSVSVTRSNRVSKMPDPAVDSALTVKNPVVPSLGPQTHVGLLRAVLPGTNSVGSAVEIGAKVSYLIDSRWAN